MNRKTLSFLACVLLPALLARADVVHLRSGGKVEGTIVEENTREVVVKTAFGTQKIARTDVASIEKGKTTREIYEEKKAALKPGDAEAIYQLALWCHDQNFGKEWKQHLEETIKADPDHAAARKALGFVKQGDAWMTPKEAAATKSKAYEDEMKAKGMVKWRNAWVTPEDKEQLEKGLVKYGSGWVTPEEKNRLEKGLVEYEGRWVKPEDKAKLEQGLEQYKGQWLPADEVLKLRQQWENAWEASGKNWKVKCNVEAGMAEEAASMLEAAWPLMKEHYGAETAGPLQANIYLDVDDFVRRANVEGPDARETLGRIDPREGVVSCWRHARDRSTVFGTLLEVSARLYGSRTWPHGMPQWLDIGSSVYFREKSWFEGKLEVGRASQRLTGALADLRDKHTLLSIQEVMTTTIDAARESKKFDAWYLESWALVRFLRSNEGTKSKWSAFTSKLQTVLGAPGMNEDALRKASVNVAAEVFGPIPSLEKSFQESLDKP
ncbi:MAG: hypothetical protein HYR85_11015 [Planctomycetes bacterium]|nr:hypothetical protein [Planctomycetota bacterium]MBI3845733.1 hypothetical protein [Planctomycetota bacterium]